MTSAAPWSGYVLIVEAAEETRETLVRVLLGSGYHVAAAATGAEAVECIRAGPAPCLILFDPADPMSGADLVLAERATGPSAELTPMVLLGVGRDSSWPQRPAPSIAC